MSHTEFNFGDFLRVLKKWLALVIILPVIAGSGAFAYFYVTYVPQFTATAIVACSAKQTSSGNIDGSTLSTSKEVAKTFKYMMTQSTTLQDAADILHENEEIEYNAYNAGTLAGMISITQVEDTYLLNVSATASNRIVARDVANAVAEASVNLAGEDGDLGFGQIAVIRRADVPSVENGTGISIKVALATLVGLALAIGIVFLLYVTDDRIKTQEDILRSYNVPVLGVIPPESVR